MVDRTRKKHRHDASRMASVVLLAAAISKYTHFLEDALFAWDLLQRSGSDKSTNFNNPTANLRELQKKSNFSNP